MSKAKGSFESKIFIEILEEFLNELSPHSFIPPFFFNPKEHAVFLHRARVSVTALS
jgi:hypothetical protein